VSYAYGGDSFSEEALLCLECPLQVRIICILCNASYADGNDTTPVCGAHGPDTPILWIRIVITRLLP
jgi:hypothetical protein